MPLNNVTSILEKSWAKLLYGRRKRGERTRSNCQEIVMHTSLQSRVWCFLSIRMDFYIDNGGFDPAAHRSPSDCSGNKSGPSHKQGSTGSSWPWKRRVYCMEYDSAW